MSPKPHNLRIVRHHVDDVVEEAEAVVEVAAAPEATAAVLAWRESWALSCHSAAAEVAAEYLEATITVEDVGGAPTAYRIYYDGRKTYSRAHIQCSQSRQQLVDFLHTILWHTRRRVAEQGAEEPKLRLAPVE